MNVTCHVFFEQNATRPPHYDSHITHSTEQTTTVNSHKLQWRLSGFELRTPAYVTRLFGFYFLILFKIQYSTSLDELLTVAHPVKKFQAFMCTVMIFRVLSKRRNFLNNMACQEKLHSIECVTYGLQRLVEAFSFDIFG